MKMIYTISEYLSKSVNAKTSTIFLFINVIIWAVAALAAGIVFVIIFKGTLEGHGLTLFCITGYSGVLVGFLGGIIYLYRNDR